MNNIFKVIWNHATQTWTAVGELASAKGKSKSVKLAAIATALLAVAGASQIAVASDAQVAKNPGIVATDPAAKNVAPTVKFDASQLGGVVISPDRVSDQFKGGDRYGKDVSSQNIPGAIVYAHDGIAIGSGTVAGTEKSGGNGHVAIGLMSRALGAGSYSPAVALGAYAVAEGQGNTALGSSAYSRGINAVAVGRLANANNDGSTALGSETKAEWQATAVGNASKAEASKATAIGSYSHAQSNSSIAIGREANVSGQAAVGIGSRTKVKGNGSAVVGNDSSVSGVNVSTLGSNITVSAGRDGAVVLGHGSDADNTTVTQEDKATVGDLTYSGFKGNLKNINKDLAGRFVSVGSENNERQIKHVAAGKIDSTSTDAINGSQLYGMTSALDTRVTKNEDDIADINTKLGDINKNVTNLDNRAWTISDGTNNSPIKDEKVTFKGENGVTVNLDKDSNTVTIRGGLTDADKQNIANDISNNIENVLNNNDVGFAIKQNGKNTLDANGNPLTKTEKVTPKDTVNFKNGNGTTVKAVTKKGATPTASDETSISVDVDGIKFTDKNGNNVVRDDNGDYVKVDANGNPTGEKVDNKDVIMNINNPAGGNTVINNLQVNGGKVEAGSKDAVNGDQLHKVAQQLNQNNHALNNKIDGVDKRASRGIATAGAMGMLPQPHISGRSMMAAATTSYRGQQSLAVGYSRLSDNGKHIIKFSGASNLAGKKDAMVGAAYGYQW